MYFFMQHLKKNKKTKRPPHHDGTRDVRVPRAAHIFAIPLQFQSVVELGDHLLHLLPQLLCHTFVKCFPTGEPLYVVYLLGEYHRAHAVAGVGGTSKKDVKTL